MFVRLNLGTRFSYFMTFVEFKQFISPFIILFYFMHLDVMADFQKIFENFLGNKKRKQIDFNRNESGIWQRRRGQ